MADKNIQFSVGKKIYLFVVAMIFIAVFGSSVISYYLNVVQIDKYYKHLAHDAAYAYSNMVDKNFYKSLTKILLSDEYQIIRSRAENNDDDAIIEKYFIEKGIYDQYMAEQDFMTKYQNSLSDVKYIYAVFINKGSDSVYDFYIIDDDETLLYESAGCLTEREPEFAGIDLFLTEDPIISHGEFGWLCSAYAPVYDSDGNYICHIGCDVDMEDIMADRSAYIMYIIIGSVLFTVTMLGFAIFFVNRIIVKPLDKLTAETIKFDPTDTDSYEDANVVSLVMKSHDEIQALYDSIRSMQINIIDYINDIKDKDERIEYMRVEMYRDALTHVGNKKAYLKKAASLDKTIAQGKAKFAIVVADMNNLKKTNDKYGHESGDDYIVGCCKILCDIFKHSPVYRIGGDEFVVVLDSIDYDSRESYITMVRHAFDTSYNNKNVSEVERYSMSVGMSEYIAGDTDTETVFNRADKIMYAEKDKFKEQYGSYR